ncbi:MAG: PRC-barrel domain-containing protein [Candidatus Komeilibacteria bacterium]|nr:PRC-barrel domain-containing protein [Candidatus Komeilibacteria bacterium]
MLISGKQLIGLAVETQSGQYLGKISDFSLEADTQTIHQYFIKPGGLNKIFSHEFLIHQQQVISLAADKMTVDDLVYKKPAASAPIEAATNQQ